MPDIAQITDTASAVLGRLLRLDFEGLRRLIRVNSLFDRNKIIWNFTHMDQLAKSVEFQIDVSKPSQIKKAKGAKALPEHYEFDGQKKSLAAYIVDRNLTALLVIKDNQITHERYLNGTKEDDLRISWSMSKSVVSLLLGAMIDHGEISKSALDQYVHEIIPSFSGTGYQDVTLLELLRMSAGVGFNEDYIDYHSDINRMGRVLAIGGSMDGFAHSLKKERKAGEYMHYVSVNTHVIGMVIRALTGRPMEELMGRYILEPLGLEKRPNILCDGEMEPFVLGGLNMTTRDYARIGLMVLNKGKWNGRQIVSADWLDFSSAPSPLPVSPEKANIPEGWLGYALHWWLPQNPQGGEFYGIGIYGQYIYINPQHNVVIVQNAGDTEFKEGEGIIEHESIAAMRKIAETI